MIDKENILWCGVAFPGLIWLLAIIYNFRCIYIGLVKKKHDSGASAVIIIAGVLCLMFISGFGLHIRWWYILMFLVPDPLLWYALFNYAFKAVRRRK
jgi:uncharacterized membrane protein